MLINLYSEKVSNRSIRWLLAHQRQVTFVAVAPAFDGGCLFAGLREGSFHPVTPTLADTIPMLKNSSSVFIEWWQDYTVLCQFLKTRRGGIQHVKPVVLDYISLCNMLIITDSIEKEEKLAWLNKLGLDIKSVQM